MYSIDKSLLDKKVYSFNESLEYFKEVKPSYDKEEIKRVYETYIIKIFRGYLTYSKEDKYKSISEIDDYPVNDIDDFENFGLPSFWDYIKQGQEFDEAIDEYYKKIRDIYLYIKNEKF